MANIRVNRKKIIAVADAIDDYRTASKKKMKAANTEVTTMLASYEGADATQFKKEWDEVDNNDSTYKKMDNALKSYAEFLRYAEKRYRETQQSAVNRANWLPK